MHLLFHGHEQTEILETNKVEHLLRAQSIKVILAFSRHLFTNHEQHPCIILLCRRIAKAAEQEGKQFDSPESAKSIESFVKTYSLHLDELLEPDITKYKTFNEFFYRCVGLSSSFYSPPHVSSC